MGFQKKATTLSICTCSTKLLCWKNQNGSICYPMVLYKRCSTADIFLGIFFFFFDKLFRKTDHSKPRIVDIYLRRMSNYYCFRRAAQVELSQCNRRNNVLRAVVKFNKCLKGTKVLAFWVFCKKSKKFSKFTGRNLC